MTHERNSLLLPERTTPQVDEELFNALEAIHEGTKEIYQSLEGSSEKKQKATTAWHNYENSELLADRNDLGLFVERKDKLESLKKQIEADGSIEPLVREMYLWKIDEDIANTVMVIASAMGDMELFHEANESVYGKPDEDIYRGALDWIVNDAESLMQSHSEHPSVVEAAQRVIDLMSSTRGYRELLAPEDATYEAVRADHMHPLGYYGLLLDGVTIPEGKVSNETGDPILHQMLTNLGTHYKVLDADAAGWSISHDEEAVKRPCTYNMPTKRFVGLGLGHEIGSHLLERLNGMNGPLRILTRGLDRYERGNEGRAVIREQVPYETFDEFGRLVRWRDILRRHIAISYAEGVGEDARHTSSEVYEFMNAIDTMYQSKLTPDDPGITQEKAAAKTDTLLVRVLKGTDGEGGAYLKDKVYLEGHVACWLTAALKGPSVISDGDLGKFDINNPRHIDQLMKFGLLPEGKSGV